MGAWRFWTAIIAAYFALMAFVLTVLFIIASFTVIPMYENYQAHGSIFSVPPK